VKTITVEVREDHLETLAQTKPMAALSELIWNALDAEATEVRVAFIENELTGLETIRISDNGHGLHYDDALLVFRNLGGSWKRHGSRTHERKRVLHGKFGKGRFRAFSLGNSVCWHSVYKDGAAQASFKLSGHAAKLGEFTVFDRKGQVQQPSGMTVEIQDVRDTSNLLRGVKAMEEVTNVFALYLRQYPDTHIIYDGIPLDPSNAETRFTTYPLGEMVTEDGKRIEATLDVVEWRLPGKRALLLCDENGFMRIQAQPRIYFRGFSYSAYLKSAHIAALDSEGFLETGELHPDIRQLLNASRLKLREHFALREAESAIEVLDYWKETGLYPYSGTPADNQEANERRIFDIYSTHLERIFSDFSGATLRTKRLVLRLMQELVHSDPVRMAGILDELITFTEEMEEQILELAGAADADETESRQRETSQE
jgi:hypothetical protein